MVSGGPHTGSLLIPEVSPYRYTGFSKPSCTCSQQTQLLIGSLWTRPKDTRGNVAYGILLIVFVRVERTGYKTRFWYHVINASLSETCL